MNRRCGCKALARKRASSKHFAHLITHHEGLKGVKDAALAAECGYEEVQQMYRCLGQKLLLLSRSCWFELRSSKRDEDQSRPVYIFTLSGVIMITIWLATERALQVGMALAPLLTTRRRASKNKQRRPRRAHDPRRQAKYQRAVGRLHVARSRLEKKIERSIGPLS
jgi:hypothetical protein